MCMEQLHSTTLRKHHVILIQSAFTYLSSLKVPKDWNYASIYIPLRGTLQQCPFFLSNNIQLCNAYFFHSYFIHCALYIYFMVIWGCLFIGEGSKKITSSKKKNIQITRIFCHLLHHEFANKNIVIEKVCAIFRMHFFYFL